MNSTKQIVFNCIKEFINKNGHPPTYRELLRLTGLRSTSTVHYYVHQLRNENKISFDDGLMRNIVVLN